MRTAYIHQLSGICSAGSDVCSIEQAIFNLDQAKGCIGFDSDYSNHFGLPLGNAKIDHQWVSKYPSESRNNQLLAAALQPLRPSIEALVDQFGEQRVATIVGTSTSGIASAEAAFEEYYSINSGALDYHYHTQEIFDPCRFANRLLGLRGPSWSVSTACTSGAKAVAMGARLVRTNLVDAALVAGVDSLCRMTIEGFQSLGVVSDSPCLPFSRNRKGINIGEGAAAMLLCNQESDVFLAGVGETSDGHHISAPHPQGRGAVAAMRQALSDANIEPREVGYVNLHGTGTIQNDLIESIAVNTVFGSEVACSSTKGITGHTLATAGILESMFGILALRRCDGACPVHVYDGEPGLDLAKLNNLGGHVADTLRYVLSNSFAFGGNNVSLIFARS